MSIFSEDEIERTRQRIQESLKVKAVCLYNPCTWVKDQEYCAAVERAVNMIVTEMTHKLTNSDRIRRTIPCRLHIPYGDSEMQKFDIFGYETLPQDSPILIYIHGGGWSIGRREDSAFIAESFYKASIVTAIIGYDLAPNVTLDEMVSVVRKAIKFIQDYVTPSRRVFIMGHSAGAQLAMCAALCGSSEDVCKVSGVISISALFDLEDLMDTLFMKLAKFDRESVDRLAITSISPKAMSERLKETCSSGMLIRVGSFDPPGFLEQHREICKVLSEAGAKFNSKIIPGKNHFDINYSLSYDDYSLTQDIIAFVKTGATNM